MSSSSLTPRKPPLAAVCPLEPLCISLSRRPNEEDCVKSKEETKAPKPPTPSRAIAEQLAALVREQVFFYNTANCPIEFPETPLLEPDSSSARPVPSLRAILDDLRQRQEVGRRTLNSIERLALDPVTGWQKTLNETQLQDIQETGQFCVPAFSSDDAKDQHHDKDDTVSRDHVWKVAAWFQKGRLPRIQTLQKDLAKALYHVVIGMPRRIYGSAWSLVKSVQEVYAGIYGLVSLVIGCVETVPKYTTEQALQEQLARVENDYVYKALGPDHPMAPAFDNALHDRLAPILSHCRKTAEDKQDLPWFRDRLVKASARHERMDEAAIRHEKFQHLTQTVLASRQLETAAPGFAQLHVNRMIMDENVKIIERNIQETVTAERDRVRKELMQQHAILGHVVEWVDTQLDRHCQTFEEQVRAEQMATLGTRAMEQGLDDYGQVFISHVLTFRSEIAHKVRNELARETVPAGEFLYRRHIWRPKHWGQIKVKGPNSEFHRFAAEKYHNYTITSNVPFWRLASLYHDWLRRLNNGLFWIYRMMWDGPLGVKSLMLNQRFLSDYKMDPYSGDIEPDTGSSTHTLRSRIRSVWKYVAEMRSDFESFPDTGLIGKPIARIFNMLVAYIGIGIPATIVLIVGQPILTVLTIGFAAFAVVTSPMWSAVGSLVTYICNILIYDHLLSQEQLDGGPWFRSLVLLGRICFSGFFRGSTAVFACVIVHPALACLRFAFAIIRYALRNVLDTCLFYLLLRPLGRIPGRDSFLAWRVAGPGITEQYACYLVPPDIAVLALRAKLELIELSLFNSFANSKIIDPRFQYEATLAEFIPFGLTVSFSETNSASILSTRIDQQRKDLETRLTSRRKRYAERWDVRSLLEPREAQTHQLGGKLGWIRQLHDDLQDTLLLGTELVRHFWISLEDRYTDRERNDFWLKHCLVPNDFEGLTRQLLTGLFSEDFLCPLEESDNIVSERIKHPDLEAVLQSVW